VNVEMSWLEIVLGVFVVVIGGWIVSGLLPRRGVESPKYKVVKKMNGYEIREYDNYIVAEVKVAGEAGNALLAGFRILLGFISGNNIGRSPSMATAPEIRASPEKISMTTPVLQVPEQNENVVAFVMPSKYTLETLPVPNDSRIRARQVPKHLEAVHQFSGYARTGSVKRQTRAFSKRLQADGIESKSSFMLSQYDPPWTPPFMRRNELSMKLEHV
jgi:hypothetical protein